MASAGLDVAKSVADPVASHNGMGYLQARTGSEVLSDPKFDGMVVLIEASLALLYNYRNATDKQSLFVATCSFFHAVTGKSCLGTSLRVFDTLLDKLVGDGVFFFQAGESWVDMCDMFHKNMHRVLGSALGNKLLCVFNHVVAHTIYAKMGIAVDPKLFAKIEEGKIRTTVWSCATFVDGIVSLVLFLCKAGRQALLTGSVEAFFIDESIVTGWLDTASRLRKDAEFISNPTAVGMTLPAYLAKLQDAIDTGNKLAKHFGRGKEHTIIFNCLLELEMIHKRHQCSLVASSFRRAPVAVFINGTAGVAKSFISEGLFNHYCSVRGIPKEDAYCWTRTEGDEYYSGYKSHFAGVLYDDAAKFRVNVVQGVDEGIKDLIAAINNIQFITNQADLPDKGKIPFRSEWVGVTSNVADLDAQYYFNSTAAFLRRFAVRITPVVKPQFVVKGSDRIDASLIPEGVQYPDMWDFDVCEPRIMEKSGRFVSVGKMNYAELLKYMTGVYEKHIKQQDRLMATISAIGPEELCACRLPKSLCQCEREGPILCDMATPTPQVELLFGDVNNERVRRLQEFRCHQRPTYALAADRLMFDSLWRDSEAARFLDPHFEHDGKESVTSVVNMVEKFVLDAMVKFQRLTCRQKVESLADEAFLTVDVEEGEYLTFTPKVGGRGFFLDTQIDMIRGHVTRFTSNLTAEESALLDVYLHEEAGKHIANGWNMKSVIRGAIDYVAFYSKRMVEPDRLAAKRLLLGIENNGWFDRLQVWFAGLYFDHGWVHRGTNWVISVPGVLPFIVWVVAMHSRGPRQVLADAGRKFDQRLGGDKPYVRMLLGVISMAGIITVLYKLVAPRFLAKPAHQADVSDVGRKPIVRETEKKNVWVVKERAISRFHVHPKRPHSARQARDKVSNNICYAEVSGKIDGVGATARTRVLIVDSTTFVLNNHALLSDCVVRIWAGPKTHNGVRPSYDVQVEDGMITRLPKRDLAIVKTRSLPHLHRNIKEMFVKRGFAGIGSSCYLVKQADSSIEEIECAGAAQEYLSGLEGADGVAMQAWSSFPERSTTVGECGSPLIVNTPLGSVIVGLHCGFLKATGKAWATPIFAEDFDLEEDFPQIGELVPAGPLAQASYTKLRPCDKLYTDFHQTGQVMVHGQLRGFIARPKFTGRKTPHADYVLGRGFEFEDPIVDNMDRPQDAGWRQPQMILANYLHPTHSMSESVWGACLEAYGEHIEQHLTEEDLEDIHPVPISVAVNGFPQVPNVDAQKFTTSAGHGHRGNKLQFLSEPEEFEEWQSFRRYGPVIRKEIQDMRDKAAGGVRPHAIYDSCMKDELLSKEKVAAGRARAIYMCPVAFLTNMRMSVMGMCRVIVRRRDVFGLAVGLNTHSEEWDDLFQRCAKMPGDNWVAGDFKAFEAVLSLLISNGASEIFLLLARLSGNYSPEEYMILRVLLADMTNPTINFFGELITLLGGEASGHQLTTFFNCVCNVLLHMYAFVCIHKVEGDGPAELKAIARRFFEQVIINTLGDDVYQKVHPDANRYHHTSIQAIFQAIGITYTMADKHAPSVPYIRHDQVTFLKRVFLDHEAFPGMKVAALARQSVYKMLVYTVPSKTASPEQQFAAAFASAQAEAFFHGRKFFVQVQGLIHDLPKSRELECRMTACPPPTWDEMVWRFTSASPKFQARTMVPGVKPETTPPERSYCRFEDLELQTKWSVDAWGSTAMGRSPEDRVYERAWLSPKKVPKAGACEEAPRPDKKFLSKKQQQTNKKVTTSQREMTPFVVEKVIRKITNNKNKKAKKVAWEDRPVLQADVAYDAAPIPVGGAAASTDVVQEIVAFKNEPDAVKVRMTSKATSIASSMEISQDLASYFARPKLIRSYAWGENGANGFKDVFYPWTAFFSDGNMLAKMRGFSLLRADLKLKFLVNGSPFYYGSMMAAYTPLTGGRADTAVATSTSVSLVANSQKPHVWIENQNMSTAEMTLPFLYPYPYVDTKFANNLGGLGKMEFIQYAPLLSANGTSSQSLDVQVYAWAENVKLSGPTDRPVMQSEFKPDGQISAMASNVASAAGKLKDVPIIGEYAMATEMVSSAVGKVASFFGFTNVPVVADVMPVKQMPFQLASSAVSEPVCKLSLQPKQETAIGAVQHGGEPEDELVISRFAGRSSFIVGSQWDTTLVPNTTLFTTAVTPSMFQRTINEIAHAPVSYLAHHFQYWRGSLRFTFRLVRSPYHRGRLQISWDRAASGLDQGPSVGNPNTFATIMDLDEQSECSFVVPYLQDQLFMPTSTFADTGSVFWSTDVAPTGSWSDGINGILSVRVVNRLSAPEPSSSATLLVFVSAEPDFQFAAPREYAVYSGNNILGLSKDNVAVVQSDIQYDDSEEAHHFVAPMADDGLYKEVFGEKIVSMREYLHRSSASFTYASTTTGTTAGVAQNIIPFKRLPPPPGVYNNGWWLGTTASGAGQRVFYTRFHPLVSLTSCFAGYKGSVNVTINVDQPRGSTAVDTLAVYRVQNADGLSASSRRPIENLLQAGGSAAINAKNEIVNTNSGRAGMALTNTKTNAGMCAQLPYYANSAFMVSDFSRMYNNQDLFTDANNDWWAAEWRFNRSNSATATEGVLSTVYYASGPDFDLIFFVNVPVLTLMGVTPV
jgi:hypothetical protein